jgi:hypothetical protein
MLSLCIELFAKLKKVVPENRLPPSRGITLATMPALGISTDTPLVV